MEERGFPIGQMEVGMAMFVRNKQELNVCKIQTRIGPKTFYEAVELESNCHEKE